jgi:hypothetical protein
MVEFNSFTIGILALAPTLVFAIKVEKHYTAFWIAAWNAFALFLAGLTLKIAPATSLPVFIQINGTFEVWWMLILYAIIVAYIGFKVSAQVLRFLCSSKIASGLLVVTLALQHFAIHDFGTVTLIFGGTVFGVWIASRMIP